MATLELLDISAYRTHITNAISYSGGTHQYEDIAEMVAAGHANYWPGPDSIVVTETITHPRARILHFFLAGGVMRELQAMAPHILDWGRSQGCTRATLIGRRGWERTFLSRTGWRKSDLILMEKDLDGTP